MDLFEPGLDWTGTYQYESNFSQLTDCRVSSVYGHTVVGPTNVKQTSKTDRAGPDSHIILTRDVTFISLCQRHINSLGKLFVTLNT